MDQATITAACVALARANVPPYVQELLLYGDPSREIPPGALRKALEAALSSLERELAEAPERAARAIMDGADRDDPMDVAIREGIVRSVRRSLSTKPSDGEAK